jgi:V-type H+-transporting ATPase subunit D
MLGITGGGQTLNVTKKHFYEFLKKIVEIATLQTSYLTIDECLKITNRRVNALEYIVVPKIEYIIKFIITELDERSKEEKFKIKKILANKRKHKENEEQQKLEQEQAQSSKAEDTIFSHHDEEDEEEQLFK